MLNSKALSDLLTKNVHPTISPRWFVMTPNATLLAYSTTNNVKELRDQAALLSMLWKEHSASPYQSSPQQQQQEQLPKRDLETLTIEFPDGNIIVRAVQSQLLLVLVGGTWAPGQPDRARFRITAEGKGDNACPSQNATQRDEGDATGESTTTTEGAAATSPARERGGGEVDDDDAEASTALVSDGPSEQDEELRMGLLLAQRGKIDAATEHMRGDFEMKGFVMPGDGDSSSL